MVFQTVLKVSILGHDEIIQVSVTHIQLGTISTLTSTFSNFNITVFPAKAVTNQWCF
jgi:hypothetical protein